MAKPRTNPGKSPRNWRAVAAQLAMQLPQNRLHARALGWLAAHAQPKEPWAAAVSGGADSVALLLLLWAHFPKARARLTVLHYDHALRAESAADADYARGLAEALGLKFATARREGKDADPSEADLRDDRWKFFRGQLQAASGRMIFLGHQRDDIAETMLMRLARGSGPGGLSAPRPVKVFADGVVALRPLLDIGSDELRTSLRAAGGAWREDPSNDADTYLRNRIRKYVIPAWRAALGERELATGVARSRALLEEDDEALDAIAKALLTQPKPGEPLKLTCLAGQSRAMWRRALRRWLEAQSLGANISSAAFEELQGALMVGEGGRWSAGQRCWVEVKDGSLMVRPATVERAQSVVWRPVTLTTGAMVQLPTGGQLQCVVVGNPEVIVEGLKSGRLEARKHACLALADDPQVPVLRARLWKAGDRYQPLGAPGRRKLQDLFTDKKIPVEERFMLPVVCNGEGQPVWVPGLPPAESHRIQPSTRRALWLTYHAPGEIM